MTNEDILYAKAKNILKGIPRSSDGFVTKDRLKNDLIWRYRIKNSDIYLLIQELEKRGLIERARQGYKIKT